MFAFPAAYQQPNNTTYLNDAIAIANWIVANLQDTTWMGYRGDYAGYTDGGPNNWSAASLPKQRRHLRCVALLAHIEALLGNNAMYTYWNTQAQVAGDFVIAMYDSADKRFYAGTVYIRCLRPLRTSYKKGSDIINTCYYLDPEKNFTLLPMAASAQYLVGLTGMQY